MYHSRAAYAARIYSETPHAPPAPMDIERERPVVLHLGSIIVDSVWSNSEKHSACRYITDISPAHCHVGIAAVHRTVCHRQIHRSFLRHDNRIRAGLGTEEHRLCRMDGLHLSQSSIIRRSRLLHTLAKLHQQHRTLAAPPTG